MTIQNTSIRAPLQAAASGDGAMSAPMRLLVCGGRDFVNREFVFAALDRAHAMRPVAVLIHGAARGADTIGAEWAKARGIQALAFPADWNRDGKAAGPIRNKRMLDEGKPDCVVAFPGGSGTAHMVRISREAKLPVWEPGRSFAQ